MVDVAQVVRASDCGSEGRRFKSGLPPPLRISGNAGDFFIMYIIFTGICVLLLYVKVFFINAMKRTINTEKIPIKLWVDKIEPGALKQARDIANLSLAFHHIAIMADCHEGFGMPIGGVLAARNVVIPNAVGVDIGCGMCALKTSLKEISRKKLINISRDINRVVPTGFNHHKKPQDPSLMPEVKGRMTVVEREFEKARHQLGTLGGGNHFIEVQKGSDGFIWIMVHSGSRNLGKQVADHYYRKAVNIS